MYFNNPVVLDEERTKELAEALIISFNRCFDKAFSIAMRAEELVGGSISFAARNRTRKMIPYHVNNLLRFYSGTISIDMFLKYVELAEDPQMTHLMKDPSALDEILKWIVAIMNISVREDIKYSEVVRSEKYRKELNSLKTLMERKLKLKDTILASTMGLIEESFVELLLFAPNITESQYIQIRNAIEREYELTSIMKRKIVAVAIASDEMEAKEFGDSQERKEKRDMLLRLLEETEDKTISELITSLMNSPLLQRVANSI